MTTFSSFEMKFNHFTFSMNTYPSNEWPPSWASVANESKRTTIASLWSSYSNSTQTSVCTWCHLLRTFVLYGDKNNSPTKITEHRQINPPVQTGLFQENVHNPWELLRMANTTNLPSGDGSQELSHFSSLQSVPTLWMSIKWNSFLNSPCKKTENNKWSIIRVQVCHKSFGWNSKFVFKISITSWDVP